MNARSSSLGVCRNDSMKSPPLLTAVEVHWWTKDSYTRRTVNSDLVEKVLKADSFFELYCISEFRGPRDELPDFFQFWRDLQRAGLSSKTFIVIRNLCQDLKLLVIHLSEKFHFLNAVHVFETRKTFFKHVYLCVLTAWANSKRYPWSGLGRFGRVRQISKGNYFMSVTQGLESISRIKLLIVWMLTHYDISLNILILGCKFRTQALEVHVDVFSDNVSESKL